MDEVMRARRSVLKRALPSRVAVPVSTPECLEWRSSDAYAVESRGFYAEWKPAVAAEAPVRKRRKQRHTLVTIQKKPTRFVTNWTPELDKNLRKCLRKFGWGAIYIYTYSNMA